MTAPTSTIVSGADASAEARDATSARHAAPSVGEVLVLGVVTFLVLWLVVASMDDLRARGEETGDNARYARIASAIRHWDFSTVHPRHFWGLPYAAAVVSLTTGISAYAAVVLISVVASLSALAVAHRLWGGLVAAWFAILSWDWMQRSALGGAEPLFVALVFAALLAARYERWLTASLLASAATTVRALGIFVLVGIAAALLARRDWRRLAAATGIGIGIGVAYAIPLYHAFGGAGGNVTFYWRYWLGDFPIAVPLMPLLNGLLASTQPLTNVLKIGAWVALILVGSVLFLASRRCREACRRYPVELTFFGLYVLFLVTVDSRQWSWQEFPRFAVPVLPFALVGLERWLPRDRRILWAVAICSGALAGASALDVRYAAAFLRLWLEL